MRYPICLIRHLFLNRPHLHSPPRSIHKNTPYKRRLAPKHMRLRLFAVDNREPMPIRVLLTDRQTRGSRRFLLRNVANKEPCDA